MSLLRPSVVKNTKAQNSNSAAMISLTLPVSPGAGCSVTEAGEHPGNCNHSNIHQYTLTELNFVVETDIISDFQKSILDTPVCWFLDTGHCGTVVCRLDFCTSGQGPGPGYDNQSWLCSQLACLGWVITWIGTVSSSSISLDRLLGGNEWHLSWAALEISFTSIPGCKLSCSAHVK